MTTAIYKVIILSSLTIHNSIVAVSMRYSRTLPGDKFNPTTVIICAEIMKLFASICLIFKESTHKNYYEILASSSRPEMLLQMAVPSVVYLAQNKLLYIAATYLDTSVFQVTFQFRILATAIFSILLLSKRLSIIQWFALVLLMVGIITVNLSVLETEINTELKNNSFIGITAAFTAACCSGFAGVYLESKFKTSSLWIRNYQIALVSIPFGFIIFLFDEKVLIKNGFFYGYDGFTIFLILMQSIGGFLVAVVIKYADNILKGFSTSFTICLTCMASHFIFNVQLNQFFGFGTIIVIVSIFIYTYSQIISSKILLESQKIDINNLTEEISSILKISEIESDLNRQSQFQSKKTSKFEIQPSGAHCNSRRVDKRDIFNV